MPPVNRQNVLRANVGSQDAAGVEMHGDQLNVSVATVRELLGQQFPQWADRAITAAPFAGAGNALFRLGDDLVVRLPRHPGSAAAIEVELRWLPLMAAQLPLAIPAPVAAGVPADVFPHPWAVFRWLSGARLDIKTDVDPLDVAARLGQFVAALQGIEIATAPASLRPNPLDGDGSEVRDDIRILGADRIVDVTLATAVWESAVVTPPCRRPVWIHGDLFPMNLLVDRGRLSAVIDFDLMGAGDPAIDMLPAWAVLTAETRPLFRVASGVDDDTWIRGRGYALSAGLGAIRKYGTTGRPQAVAGRHALTQTVADYQHRT